MAEVTVTPEEFTMVDFDAAEIVSIAEDLVEAIGLPGDTRLSIEIDESSPLGRSRLESVDPVVIATDGGSLEDPKRPRQPGRRSTTNTIGRLLFRVHDHLDDEFGAPSLDEEIDLPYGVAWDVYSFGRLARLGYPAQRQRWLYHFRNRCGFTDVADACFERLWTGEDLTWSDLRGAVDRALSVEEPTGA